MTLNDDQIQQIINDFTQNVERTQIVNALQAQVVLNADGTTDYATTLANLTQTTPQTLIGKVALPPIQAPPVKV